MKKLILFLTAIFTLTVSALCFAADGDDLNKQQTASEVFINAFTDNVPDYDTFTAGFDDELKARVNRQAYLVLQQQVKERFGKLRESKFYSYQRFDQGDRVTYIASFDNANLVAIVFSFDKDLKLVNFALTPMQQQNSQAAAE